MIVLLDNSELFTVSPDVRFSRAQGVRPGVFKDLFTRHKLHGLRPFEMRRAFEASCGKRMSRQAMLDWIWRAEVFMLAKPLLDKGTRAVQSSFFGEHEPRLVKELTRNMVAGRGEPRALL